MILRVHFVSHQQWIHGVRQQMTYNIKYLEKKHEKQECDVPTIKCLERKLLSLRKFDKSSLNICDIGSTRSIIENIKAHESLAYLVLYVYKKILY